jgi:hypothetical protein
MFWKNRNNLNFLQRSARQFKENFSLYELQFSEIWERKNETYTEKPGLLDEKIGKIIGCFLLL